MPGEVWAAASGVAVVGGLLTVVLGLRRREPGPRMRYSRRGWRISRATAVRAVLGVVAGVALLTITE